MRRCMSPRMPTVADLVRRAVEVCDPDEVDPDLGRLQQELEDDDRPVTAVGNLEEHLAIALEGADYDGDNPAVSVAAAVVLYLASKGGAVNADLDPGELIELAVRAQWHGDPPAAVADWVAGR
jgi:hypothetical protein